jgi:hypothetical protein
VRVREKKEEELRGRVREARLNARGNVAATMICFLLLSMCCNRSSLIVSTTQYSLNIQVNTLPWRPLPVVAQE